MGAERAKAEERTMRAWLGTGLVVGAIGILAAACSSTAADKYASSESFCSALADEECQSAAACAVPKDKCLTARQNLCNAGAAQAVSQGRQYKPANAQSCIDKAHKYYDATHVPLTPAELADMAEECGRVFAGTIERNGACTSDLSCSDSLICDKGRCGARSVVRNANDGCANAGEVCDTGLYCSTASPNVCQPRKKLGETCDKDAPCIESLRCEVTCKPRLPAGTKCTSDDECDVSAPYCSPWDGNICNDGIRFSVKETELCKTFGGG
jgi:hypothetical protein